MSYSLKVNNVLPPIEDNCATMPTVTLKLELLQNTLVTKRTMILQIDNKMQDIKKEVVERSTSEEDLEDVICKTNTVLSQKKVQTVNGIDVKSSSNNVQDKCP